MKFKPLLIKTCKGFPCFDNRVSMKPVESAADHLVYATLLLMPVFSAVLLGWLIRARGRAVVRAWLVLCVNLLVLFVLLTTALAAAETYYRFAVDTTDSFGLTRMTLRWFHRHWRSNRAGYRDSLLDYPTRRIPGVRRITFLGDSFTAGHGVADVEARFANRLRKETHWDIHVPADVGYDTGHELQIAKGLLQQNYEFEDVVLVYNLNDIGDLSPAWKAASQRMSSERPPGLIRHSYFLNTIYFRLKGRLDRDVSNYCQSLVQCYDGPLWEQQQQRLLELKNLVEKHGAHFRVVTFPFLQHLGPAYEYRDVHARLARFWRDAAVPQLDLLELFEACRSEPLTVNGHDAHPNELAHALAATAIQEFLEKAR
jgi:hypothetical protein